MSWAMYGVPNKANQLASQWLETDNQHSGEVFDIDIHLEGISKPLRVSHGVPAGCDHYDPCCRGQSSMCARDQPEELEI